MPLKIVRQDIVLMEVDAIVNPANTGLRPGGGCCGAIHRAAGPELAEACAAIGHCDTGEAVITPGFSLPAKYIIHTPGPIWDDGNHDEERLLKNSYKNSLRLAAENGCESIAFPLISAGIYGYPSALALEHAREAISDWLFNEDRNDMLVYLLLFTNSAFLAGNRLFRDVLSYIDDNYEGVQNFEAERAQFRNARLRDEFPECYMSEPEPAYSDEEVFCDAAAPEATESRPKESRAIRPDKKPYQKRSLFGSLSRSSSLDAMLDTLDESFSGMLIRLIDENGLKDSDVYKRANVDRKLFNKIKLNPAYHPTKQTALAFAIALRLSLDATKELIGKAGYALTHASRFDIVIEYFILHNRYDIMEINEILFELDEALL